MLFVPQGLPVAASLALLSILSCARASLSPDFGPPRFRGRLLVFVEPGTRQGDLERALVLSERVLSDLQTGVLAPLQVRSAPKGIELWLFRSQSSYREFAGRVSQLPTTAHFARREMRVYIAVDAAEDAFRHELTHAIIESARPHAPYWVHEGLAGFAQTNPHRPNCKKPGPAALPGENVLLLGDRVRSLRARHSSGAAELVMPFGLSCSKRKQFDVDHLLAAHLFLFVYQQARLDSFLTAWRAGTKPEAALITALGASCSDLAPKFLEWLEGSGPRAGATGC